MIQKNNNASKRARPTAQSWIIILQTEIVLVGWYLHQNSQGLIRIKLCIVVPIQLVAPANLFQVSANWSYWALVDASVAALQQSPREAGSSAYGFPPMVPAPGWSVAKTTSRCEKWWKRLYILMIFSSIIESRFPTFRLDSIWGCCICEWMERKSGWVKMPKLPCQTAQLLLQHLAKERGIIPICILRSTHGPRMAHLLCTALFGTLFMNFPLSCLPNSSSFWCLCCWQKKLFQCHIWHFLKASEAELRAASHVPPTDQCRTVLDGSVQQFYVSLYKRNECTICPPGQIMMLFLHLTKPRFWQSA